MVQLGSRIGSLPTTVETVLVHMFAEYGELIVRNQFTSGLSGGCVYLVRPIRANNTPELPAVVKIDRVARIQQEWRAYREAIQDKLPSVAEIKGQPVFPPGSLWGGLRYPLVGSGEFEVESFHQFYNHASEQSVLSVLETRLFRSLSTLWRQADIKPELHIQTSYDAFLPGNLLIECQPLPAGVQARPLHPNNTQHQTWIPGEYVQFYGFQVVKITQEKQQLSLDMPPHFPLAFRFQVQGIPNVADYEVGQIIYDQMTGVILKNRAGQLEEQVKSAFGARVDVKAETIKLPNQIALPNPLYTLPRILNESFDAKVAYIHGDLNLENILVDPQAQTVQLIDFAKSGKDHVLKDLIYLETAVLTKLLPDTLAQIEATPEKVCSLYERLHCATLHPDRISPPPGLEKPFAVLCLIRRTAQEYLFKPGEWKEYYRGLTIYLLGCLKFDDLDKLPTAPAPKQVAFWAAAMVQKLMTEKADCEAFSPAPSLEITHSPLPNTVTHQTNFYAPVTSPVHAGSGNIIIEQSSTSVDRPLHYNHEIRLQIREFLLTQFSESELRDFWLFFLKLDYENLPGRSKPDKVREMITYCERHEIVPDLIRACRQARNNVAF